ncbi:MAG TPA: hypothetical protein RMH99_04410 [Sandaracinaceae bacterium LLY-WYZ-13_1]|nr:hypothetical protein [Sandaracinaceae bacterium LLY-WYZ-13_1]
MNDPMDSPSLEASLDDLKVIYKVLTVHRTEHPELEGNGFFESLQRLLEAQARVEGVDVEDDGEWEAWLADVEEASLPETPRDMLN